MKLNRTSLRRNLTLFSILIGFACQAQEVVELPYRAAENVVWENEENEYFSKIWNSTAANNVSKPTLLVYKPSSEKRNGTSVIIAPGGGMYALSIENEGYSLAKWLNDNGITVFVLKYRLVPTGKDGVRDLLDILKRSNEERIRITKEVLPYSVEDGLAAVEYVRTNAAELGVSPDKIGFMGFSAGGVITFGVVNESEEKNRPNFFVPVYPGTDLIDPKPDADTPPTLFVAAADDQLIGATVFTGIFDIFHSAGVKTALHMYAEGGHGFASSKRGLEVDNWLDRFYEWAVAEGMIDPVK
ncbi:MAG: alpha/beta hydrolase [Cyclobacteriaceae bacterium]